MRDKWKKGISNMEGMGQRRATTDRGAQENCV